MPKAVFERAPWGGWYLLENQIIAGVVRSGHGESGVTFVTPNEFGLQVAKMNRPKGHSIPSHSHLPVPRALIGTQEVLIIQKGQLRADLFDDGNSYLASIVLSEGDVLILNSGGHGFFASEDCLFIEVKQGPFVEGKDKEVFPNSVGSDTPIRLIE